MARQLGLVAAPRARGAIGTDSDWDAKAHQALREIFGFECFRGRQLDAIRAALTGRDCFVLMPTGGGKSLCYGLVPSIREGLVLVVSPLIALMQDQVQGFCARGLRADFLSSARSEADRRRLLDDLQSAQPQTQLLYVTPELLATEGFMRCLRGAYAAGTLRLVAVDEAHCVSSMGHDFRPQYRRLGAVRQELPRVPLMALTATASEAVQLDIVRQLRMRDPLLLKTSFNRPNISYHVRYVDLMRDKQGRQLATPLPDIIALLQAAGGGSAGGDAGGDPPGGRAKHSSPNHQRQAQQQGGQQAGQQQQQQQRGGPTQVPCAIIYCRRREDVEAVAAALRAHSIPCAAYHAGLPDAARSAVLREWQAGRVAVVAATIAFGMGIDRADVRLVLHYSLPSSLEAYYQEAGRAGRDGRPSRSIVYYRTDDRQRQEYVVGKGQEQRQRRQGGGGGAGDGGSQRQLQQFGQVVDYCLSPSCRRATVLRHFGEQPPPRPAGAAAAAACCDCCADGADVAAALKQLAGAGAQRRQQFAGGKHTLDFSRSSHNGGRGGAGGGAAASALEFERSWAPEGLDYDEERPSRALQESEGEEDAIQGSSDEDEGERGLAAAAALRQAQRAAGGSQARLLAAMERAEARHAQEQAAGGSKKARLLHKLEGGGGGSAAGSSTAGRGVGGVGSGSSALTHALRQAAQQRLTAALSSNASLAAQLGSGSQAEAVAAELEQQLATGQPSKPVYQSKLSNLMLQLKKAGAAADVAGLAAALASQGRPPEQASACGAPAAQAAGLPLQPAAALTADTLQQQVGEAARLAEQATGGGTNGSTNSGAQEAAAAAGVAALRSLAGVPVTAQLLQQTGAGRRVHQLKKHPNPLVAAAAAEVEQAWRAQLVVAAGG